MFKRLAILTAGISAALSMTAFAAGWHQNDIGWWYCTSTDETEWYADGWHWIDGNDDGIAECYYFNSDGYMLANTETPDGYTVNADGAWTEDGVVQTRTTDIDSSMQVEITSQTEHGTPYVIVTSQSVFN